MDTYSQIITAINVLIDDEQNSSDIVPWINGALGDLGIAVSATFPKVEVSGLSVEPVIPYKWRELLVLYGAARGKEKESAIAEADRFMVQYEQKKKEFVTKYTVPDEYKDEATTDSEYPPNPFSWWGDF